MENTLPVRNLAKQIRDLKRYGGGPLLLALIVLALLIGFVGFVLSIVDVALVSTKTSSSGIESFNCSSICANLTGPQGERGFNGSNGMNGENGGNGSCLVPCVNGTQGIQGPMGLAGVNGTVGPNGTAGICSQSCYRGNTTFAPFNQTYVIYVDKSGSDTSGSGDPTYPFITVGKAMASILSATQTTPFEIHVGPGIFVESIILLKPWVWVIGAAPGLTVMQPTNVSLDPLWNTTSGSSGFANIELDGATLTLNFQLFVTLTFTRTIYFTNVFIDDGLKFFGQTESDSAILQNCIVNNGVATNGLEFHGGLSIVYSSSLITGNVLVDDLDTTSGQVSFVTFTSNLVSSTSSLILRQFTSSNFIFVTLSKTLFPLAINATGNHFMTVKFDAVSFPSAGISSSTGATLTLLSNAFGVGYVPSVSGNWNTLPINAGTALDELSGNLQLFSYQDSGPLTLTISVAGGAPVSMSARIERFGKTCQMIIEEVTLTSGSTPNTQYALATTIPSAFVPATNQQSGTTLVSDFSVSALQVTSPVFVNNDGSIAIAKDSGQNFFGTGTTVVIGGQSTSGLSWKLI